MERLMQAQAFIRIPSSALVFSAGRRLEDGPKPIDRVDVLLWKGVVVYLYFVSHGLH